MKAIQNEHKDVQDTLTYKITCVIPMDTGIFLSHTAEKSVLNKQVLKKQCLTVEYKCSTVQTSYSAINNQLLNKHKLFWKM